MRTIIGLHYSDLSASAAVQAVPDWVQLIPAGTFSGDDGRGPYVLENAETVIAASLRAGRKLPIDINHATDLKAVEGEPAPAVGWIVEMQARSDGLWGRVEWTDLGRHSIERREYAYISPAIESTASKPYKITRLLRASLVNDPNFIMQSLHKSQNRKETPMDPELLAALGLSADADAPAVLTAVTALQTSSTALQTSLNAVAKALGLDDSADADAVVTSLNAKLKAAPLDAAKDATIAALQEQVTTLSTRLQGVVDTHGKRVAEQVVDLAIKETRLVPALREHYIARHMKDPKAVETELAAFPPINGGGIVKPPVSTEGGDIDEAGQKVVALMGLDPVAYAKTHAQITKEFG